MIPSGIGQFILVFVVLLFEIRFNVSISLNVQHQITLEYLQSIPTLDGFLSTLIDWIIKLNFCIKSKL